MPRVRYAIVAYLAPICVSHIRPNSEYEDRFALEQLARIFTFSMPAHSPERGSREVIHFTLENDLRRAVFMSYNLTSRNG